MVAASSDDDEMAAAAASSRSMEAAAGAPVPTGGGRTSPSPPRTEPVGWAAARGVDVGEARRLTALLVAAAKPDEATGAMAVDMVVPTRAVRKTLLDAAAPLALADADSLVAAAPAAPPGGAGVAVGALVKFWFDVVWPRHRDARQGAEPQHAGALAVALA